MGLDANLLRSVAASPPTNNISEAIVGHGETTASFCRIENNQVLVELTLSPSEEEVVARIPVGTGQAFASLKLGQRVVACNPGGRGDNWIVLAKVSDNEWPMPTDVAKVPVAQPAGPAWSFLRLEDGELLAIETGDGGDLCPQRWLCTHQRSAW
jgi:hypothetical protein